MSWQPDQTVMGLKTLHPRVLWLRDSGLAGQHEPSFLPPEGHFVKHSPPTKRKPVPICQPTPPYSSLCFTILPGFFFFFFPVWISKYNMLAIFHLKDGSSLFWGENASPNPIRGDCLFHVQALNSTLCHNPSKFFCHNKSFPMPPEQCSKVSHICYWLITR